MANIITVRMFGYDISLVKPNRCPYCNKNNDPDILQRVVETTDKSIRYFLILECTSCKEVFFSRYDILKDKPLEEKEKETRNNPISPTSVIFEKK